MFIFHLHRWLRSHWFFCFMTGWLLLGFSGFLLINHAHAIREVTGESAPLAGEIPILERRLQFLQQQLEMAQLHTALRTGSQEERLTVFVLPEESDLDRLLGSFDILREVLGTQGHLSDFAAIDIGEREPTALKAIQSESVSFSVSVDEEGFRELMTFLRIAGLLTIGDVLGQDDLAKLLHLTEEENPAGLIALEQFLSTDLLQYARDVRSYEDQLLKSFSSPSFTQALHAALQSPPLRNARRLLEGPIGKELQAQKLWPLQMLTLNEARVERGSVGGWYRVGFELSLMSMPTISN